MARKFYVDSCIWLNLFKKEGNPAKVEPYWKIAKDFLDYAEQSNFLVVVSPFILKEIKFRLNGKYPLAKEFFSAMKYIKLIRGVQKDYHVARKIESAAMYNLSFYDCLHIAVCKRIRAVLVTRDNKLLEYSKQYINAKKPEQLID